ncbi:FecR family protein [Isoptericola jiangsuensis]|uniref:FecR family protein n=1 Tax=Isoptericola jiangsuensis TaxID=548579 RepID=UPI003868BA0F
MSQPDSRHDDDRPDAAPLSQEEDDARENAGFMQGEDLLEVEAAGWMVRLQDGLTAAEQAELGHWLARDPGHAQALARLQGTWERLEQLPAADVAALKAGLSTPPSPASGGARRRRRSSPTSSAHRAGSPVIGRVIPRAAAAVVAFAALGSAWFGWNHWQRQPTFEQSFATGRGEQREVLLPDGSTLWLDTATHADVSLYRTRREVRLSGGQVFFAVHPDPQHPFDVLTANTRVTVVGTHFSVRHTGSGIGGDGNVSVAVEEGHVRVAKAQDAGTASPAVDLLAGQSVVVDLGGEPGPVGNEVDTAWREGRISFNGTRLDEALAEFERYGDTGLVIRDPAVAALKVQGSFNLRRVSAFARALPQVLPVRLDARDGHTEIVSSRTN